MTPHPFRWLYREGDHRNNLAHAASLLRIACEVDLNVIGSEEASTLHSLLMSVADVIDITQQQTAPQA